MAASRRDAGAPNRGFPRDRRLGELRRVDSAASPRCWRARFERVVDVAEDVLLADLVEHRRAPERDQRLGVHVGQQHERAVVRAFGARGP